jgi:hypothetical protein
LRLALDFRHVGRKTIAAARDGLDVVPLAERFAQDEDVLTEVALLDEAVRPERGHEHFFREKAPAALQQEEQELRGLRGQGDAGPVAAQQLLMSIEEERSEGVEVRQIVRGNEFENALRSL